MLDAAKCEDECMVVLECQANLNGRMRSRSMKAGKGYIINLLIEHPSTGTHSCRRASGMLVFLERDDGKQQRIDSGVFQGAAVGGNNDKNNIT